MTIGNYRKRITQTAIKHSIGDVFDILGSHYMIIEITKGNWYKLECISCTVPNMLASDDYLRAWDKLYTITSKKEQEEEQ